jgi:hypothetical protein
MALTSLLNWLWIGHVQPLQIPTMTRSNHRMLLLFSDGRHGMLRIADAERLQVRPGGCPNWSCQKHAYSLPAYRRGDLCANPVAGLPYGVCPNRVDSVQPRGAGLPRGLDSALLAGKGRRRQCERVPFDDHDFELCMDAESLPCL